MTLLVEAAVSTAWVVEMACVAARLAFGALPASMTDDHAPGPSHPAFRRAARAGLDGAHEGLLAAIVAMPREDRRAAADTALDTLVGFLGLAGPL
ncbi:hypothetical protein ACFRCG_03415 [Embleya sp. NPDC056575]|uniref:hypothetical protein n=1 Tax=unclassified Embleya TaxID=2699296 RepID=UPI0036B701D5